tara:strand:- start:260 stop:880 length:621 start_codon:yes stop_codon:yes gene_type:complete
MATVRTISDFKSKLTGGGARPNLFEVSIPNLPAAATTSTPAANLNDETFQFLCKATNMPASNVASIDVPFRGRIFKVAGDRTIDNWSVTVINDEGFELRNAFEAWMNAIAKLDNNTGATNPTSYMTDAFVTQLGRGGKDRFSTKNQGGKSASALKTYKFVDIFPVNVSAIDLSYDSSDTIEEFTVEFAVQSFEAGDPKDLAAQILK